LVQVLLEPTIEVFFATLAKLEVIAFAVPLDCLALELVAPVVSSFSPLFSYFPSNVCLN